MRSSLTSRFALLVAEFFYCGRFPFAPGTAGSLASLALWVPSIYFEWSIYIKIFLLIALFIIGGFCSEFAIQYYGKNDPKQVVIDEVVGQGIPFLIIASTFLEILFAFLLFRFFDILKPWPIKTIEYSFQDKWGIMIDDVVAGIFATAVLFVGKYVLATT